jgi:hypothetical protein
VHTNDSNLLTSQLRGRVVTVFGEYKTGKTWLLGKLIGKASPDSAIINTPGLGFILPDNYKFITPTAPVAKPSGRSRKDKRVASIVPESVVEYIVIDSQGSNKAHAVEDRPDAKATEMFIRHVQLQLADRFVCVISRYDQSASDYVSQLIYSIQSQEKKKITSQNRLLVVHNMKDVLDNKTLQHHIAEVGNIYSRQTIVSSDGTEETRDYFLPITDEETGFVYYQAALTEHLFLVQHSPNSEDWACKHNTKAFKVMKTLMRCDPRAFNLLDEFNKQAENIMPDYVAEAKDPDFTIQRTPMNDQQAFVVNPPLKEGADTLTLLDRDFKNIWEDINEGEQKLKGNVFMSPTQYKIFIPVGGLQDLSSVSIKTVTHNQIAVQVKIPQYRPGDGWISVEKGVKAGAAKFRYTCNPDYTFETPSKDLRSFVQLESGLLIITLKLEVRGQTSTNAGKSK